MTGFAFDLAVDDPDDGDSVYGAGDQVRIVFDQATDKAVLE